MSLTAKELQDLEVLEFRHLSGRLKKSGYRGPMQQKPIAKPAPELSGAIKDMADAIKVAVMEPRAEPKKPDNPIRRWKFNHRYDEFGKLVETIATAE